MLRNKKINKKNDSSYRNSIWIKYDGTWNSSRLCVAYGRRKKIKNMSRISPKLIDVENNRVFMSEEDIIITINKLKNNHQQIKFKVDGNSMNHSRTMGKSYSFIELQKGRFPTQLFCNIKNDRFKYVKYIDTNLVK